jgi:cytochrome c
MSRAVLAFAVTSALALAACSPPQSGDQQGSTSSPTPPAPPPLTDAQRAAALAALPAPYSQANLENGQARFALCRSCHLITPGGSLTGPSLYGMMGRRAGTIEGFNYSAGLRSAGFNWDGPRMDAWITNPRTMIPDTKMTFAGMSNADDRRDLIAYLMVEGAPRSAGPATNSASNTAATNTAP